MLLRTMVGKGVIFSAVTMILSCIASAQGNPPGTRAAAAPPPPLQSGHLVVRGDMDGILVIDGEEAGAITDGGYLNSDVSPGEHFIELRVKDIACRWEKKIMIPPGMQVAERTEFRSACSTKETVVAVPSTPQQPSEADSTARQAQQVHDRGCVLVALGRYGEAITMLERATSELSSLDSRCLNEARSSLKRNQDALRNCEDRASIPAKSQQGKILSASERKLTLDQRRQNCLSVWGYETGNYTEAVAAITNTINVSENLQAQPAYVRAGIEFSLQLRMAYQKRALALFAVGNSAGALRDLQTSMELWKRGPDIREYENYFYRAVILSEMRVASAIDDCTIVLAAQIGNLNPSAQSFCADLPGFGQSVTRNANQVRAPLPSRENMLQPTEPTVRDEVEKIRTGTHAPMPPAQRTKVDALPASGRSTMTIKNSTAYELSVFFDGPVSKKLTMSPGASQDCDLAAGAFHVAGRVTAANVLPFYGEQTYTASTRYSITFYIAP